MNQVAVDGQLPAGLTLLHTDDLAYLTFDRPRQVLSSAVLNGGFCVAGGLLNLRVPADAASSLEEPDVTLQRVSDELPGTGVTVGMMTAASMKSLRIAGERIEKETLHVVVTTGLNNARRAADPAEQRTLTANLEQHGTINLVALTSARLTDACMVEMVAIATEAKAAVLQELKVLSPVTGLIATGTGTDAVAIVAGTSGEGLPENQAATGDVIRFAGKHTLLGERLAVLVMDAIRSSISYKEPIAP